MNLGLGFSCGYAIACAFCLTGKCFFFLLVPPVELIVISCSLRLSCVYKSFGSLFLAV